MLLKVKCHVLKTFFAHNVHFYFTWYLQNFIISHRCTYEYIQVAVILILVICSWEAYVTHFVLCRSVQYNIMINKSVDTLRFSWNRSAHCCVIKPRRCWLCVYSVHLRKVWIQCVLSYVWVYIYIYIQGPPKDVYIL